MTGVIVLRWTNIKECCARFGVKLWGIIRKVKSHTTDADVVKGIITPLQKKGNDEADLFAKKGADFGDVPAPVLKEVRSAEQLVKGILSHIVKVLRETLPLRATPSEKVDKIKPPKAVYSHEVLISGGRIVCTRCWASCSNAPLAA